jgi:hypothetical protein
MENKKILSIIALGVVALLGAGLVFAHQGDPSTVGPNYSEERHAAMQSAFDNLDFNAWAQLMSEAGMHGRIRDFVNENNFATFAEMHEAMEDGNLELAQELRTELGLGQGMMFKGQGNFQGMKGQGMGQGFSNRMMGDCPYAN